MVPSRLLSICVNDISTMGTLESSGGFTWVRETSDVSGRVVPIVLAGDATAGLGVGCTVACSDGVATTGVAVTGVLSSNQLS